MVKIKWVDAAAKDNLDEGEFDEKQNINELLGDMETYGMLYKETDIAILLVQERDNGTVRDWTIIPKGCIVKITKFIEEKVN